jgi:putative pyruvate formate lyase activating enzyme
MPTTIELPESCALCPRRCGVNRAAGERGVCGADDTLRIARAALHLWEEPVISVGAGSGTVFFSGCPLQCVFCQNHDISSGNFGQEISIERLAEIFLELQEQGANNINLVTATHYVPQIIEALNLVKGKLQIPVVYNSSGYETMETLKLLEGYVDIYLPDLKYMSNERALRYSNAKDYVETATAAILEMFRQTGPYVMENGQLKRGVLIRHLLLPGELENTRRVIDWVAETFQPGDVLFSVMSQYTPQPGAVGNLARQVTKAEYRAAVSYMENCGIVDGFTQERTSAKEEYTPDFDLRGV